MIRQLILSTALLGTACITHAELVVIAHPATATQSIPVSQLNRLFLGQSTALPDGSRAVPLDVSGDTRNQFYRDVLKRQPEQVEKYWARMIFTGKAQPPREIRPNDVKSTVAETPGALSYIDSNKVDSSVKVIRVTGN